MDELCVRCRALGVVERWEPGLAGHSRRVTMIAGLVADQLEVTLNVREEVELGGLLHDIGKVEIPEEILDKPGRLDDDERAVMETHVTVGEALAESIDALPESVPTIVRHSHERWDGGGYPDGLRGEEIPVAARIVSCADAYDAMTSSRSYRAALPLDLAVSIVREEAGRQFDPTVAEALVRAVTSCQDELLAEPVTTAFEETLRRLNHDGEVAAA